MTAYKRRTEPSKIAERKVLCVGIGMMTLEQLRIIEEALLIWGGQSDFHKVEADKLLGRFNATKSRAIVRETHKGTL